MSRIINIDYHGDVAIQLYEFWNKHLGIPFICLDGPSKILKFSNRIPGPANPQGLRSMSKGALIIVPNRHVREDLCNRFPFLNSARFACYPHSIDPSPTSAFKFIVAVSRITCRPDADCIIIPKLTGLYPDNTPREFGRVSSFINEYHRWKTCVPIFSEVRARLVEAGMSLVNYGSPFNHLDWYKAEDVKMMRRSMCTVHIRHRDATPNAVCKSIAVGTPVFMDSKTFETGGFDQIGGIIHRPTIGELVYAIIRHCHSPQPLLDETAECSISNQTVREEVHNSAIEWFERATK